jgi:transposase-like protein
MSKQRPRLWDPKRVEQEFVTSELSIRELARRHGVSQSSMAKHARDNDWKGKRIAYKAAISRRGYEHMAAEIAAQEGIIREESIIVMRATLRKYAEGLAAGDVHVNTKDAVEAVKTIAQLMGEPDSGKRDADNARTVSKPDAEHLRRVAEAARERARPVILEGSPGEGKSGAKPN